jgi:beta-N-acetylhexosaminidase
MLTIARTALLLVLTVFIVSIKPPTQIVSGSAELAMEKQWVDSVFSSLSLDQKIGQLFMVATYSDRNNAYKHYFEQLIQDYNIGGLIFFQGGPHRQVALINQYQSLSKVPLFIGIDGEWGLGMRLDSVIDFPKQMTLGAIQNDSLIYKMGLTIGQQCQQIGVHINFAPVADINSNPRNPVIGIRSFGEDRENVTDKSAAYMKGLQHCRIIATAKHFPGHGDTGSDSHYTLPVVSHSYQKLNETDLYPFKRLIADSLMGIITGHLYVPKLDSTPNLAASLSEKVITQLLKKQMGFKGLVFTDAMNMRGVSRGKTAVEINIKALLAGNDILLCPESVIETIKKIKAKIEKGTIAVEVIDEKVIKILHSKYWAGLSNNGPISDENLSENLNTPTIKAGIRDLCEAAVTLVRNDKNILPLQKNDTYQFASVAIGASYNNEFQKTLSRFATFKHVISPDKPSSAEDINDIMRQVGDANVVIVSLHDRRTKLGMPYQLSAATAELIYGLQEKAKVIVCVFGSPYSIDKLPDSTSVICAYEDLADLETIVPQQIFGSLAFKGKLPVSVGSSFPLGSGQTTNTTDKLIWGLPEQVGMNSGKLSNIDTIVKKAIQNKIFPGCQVLVARKGRIVYQKNFGTFTYDKPDDKVQTETLYDLASVTKVTATLQAVMLLYEEGKLDLKQKASFYLSELQHTNKREITIEELLLHRSGMIAFYPSLWERTLTSGRAPKPDYYSSVRDSVFVLQIAPKLFAKMSLRDSVWKWIGVSPLMNRRAKNGQYPFNYSDLGLVVLQKTIERITKKTIDIYLQDNFYVPLQMTMTGYNPLSRFSEKQIAPTENDYSFRYQLLQGTAHDQMAAVVGGISGHAGLFSNVTDLAQLMQMNLQKGSYAGKRYFKPETLSYFNTLYDEANHRGLGWDKAPTNRESNYVAPSASRSGFGHSGFTGTMVWADPEQELVFVFLSNRVYPRADNNELNRQKIRAKIHESVYQSIIGR